MTRRTLGSAGFLALSVMLLAPPIASAQSAITGVVRDTSGGVLPGVTVEAMSPALIEKVRTVFTDDRGVYRIVDLRPGTYMVTFSLAGFSTLRREGINLPASFTATVNVELRVGAIEETVTVSGQAPLVDVQSTSTQQVLSDETMNALPTVRTPMAFLMTVPGVSGAFVGVIGRESKDLKIHGGRTGEQATMISGFNTAFAGGLGGGSDVHYQNLGDIEELTIQTAASSAEYQTGGINTSIVPKEGGNTFSGFFYGAYTGETLQADNLRDDLRARGLNTVTGIKSMFDFNPAYGGRVIRDKLWFYVTMRKYGYYHYYPGLFATKDPKAWKYEADPSRKAPVHVEDRDITTRLTWQATPANKISAFVDYQPHVQYQRTYRWEGVIKATEATQYVPFYPNALSQILWRSTVSSRLLVEAGGMANIVDWNERRQPDVGYDIIPAYEATLNLRYRSAWPTDAYGQNINRLYMTRAAVSYVTGSHAFKAGMNLARGTVITTHEPNGNYGVTLRNGVPISILQFVTPNRTENRINADLGVFAQDQWTLRRMTLSVGLRYDRLNSMAVAQKLGAGLFVPARDFPDVRDVPNWHDLSPRLGTAYDLFGNGKTALKATLNRYVTSERAGLAGANNPVNTSVTNVTRTWGDANGDFIPDCDLTNPFTNGECGQISDLNFGRVNPRATQYDPDLLRGFGKRGYNWETSVAVQRALASSLMLNVGYFRRWYGNQRVTDNLEVTPADFDPYCLTVPLDPRLPGGGGNQLCGLYDVSMAKFGRARNFVTFAKNFGKESEVYNGVDVTVNARFSGGSQVSGGLATGRTGINRCYVVDSPQQLQFCDVTPPFQPEFKFSGVYALPWWGIQASGVFQSVPPELLNANYVATNAEIRPTLGRNLASGANGTVTVPLFDPATHFLERANQLDFRLSKVFAVRKARIEANVDLFNVFNGDALLLVNDRYGANWQLPTTTQNARYVQFSTQVRF